MVASPFSFSEVHPGLMFQSPSLRGSGRFRPLIKQRRCTVFRFNPLHCGAVVASGLIASGITLIVLVSIPFIAGQWSLRSMIDVCTLDLSEFQSPSLRGSGRFGRRPRRGAPGGAGFNPLHCGAVVASRAAGAAVPLRLKFQSPSLRGSGRFAWNWTTGWYRYVFQSPSLRGSGRFS